MPIEIESLDTVYEPPADEPRRHVCEPRVVRLATGTLLLSHRTGTRRESGDGSPQLLLSWDEGASWTSVGLPFEPLRPPGWDFRRASLAQLRSGSILTAILSLDKSSGRRMHNPKTEGALPIHARFARSDDEGATWSHPWSLVDVGVSQLAAEQLLVLPNGDVLCTYERFKAYEDPDPWHYEGGSIRSVDAGATWQDARIAAATDYENDPDETMWWDPRIARLSDGRLVQFYHAYHHRSGSEGPLHVAWSDDDAWTWQPPSPTSLRGQVAYPIPLARGGLVVFQQRRAEPQTMVAAFSADGGRTFGPDEAVVYRHEHESAPAANGSLSPGAYMGSMDHFTFGHPTGVELEPDHVFVSWYAGGRERTSILGARLRIHRP